MVRIVWDPFVPAGCCRGATHTQVCTQVCACCSIACSFVASNCVCMLCLWFVVRKHHFVLLGANQDLMLFDIMLFDPYTVILQLSAATAVRTAASACCNPCSLVNFCLYVHNTSHVNISILFLLRRTHKPPTKWNEYCESPSHSPSLSHMFSLYSTLLYSITLLSLVVWREKRLKFSPIWLYAILVLHDNGCWFSLYMISFSCMLFF